uniref:B-cell receptor CD22 n=1 Tax=Sus scrofa TaxID=9823 RepID=A0A8D1S8W9_PIG
MHLLGLSLLLLVPEYLAFADSASWTVNHPKTLYAWNGTCIWIPCSYKIPGTGHTLENLTVYHNFEYDKRTRDYTGTVLYKNQKAKEFPSRQERVQFLGNDRNNCTLLISPVNVNDTGKLGLRMTSVDNNKWLEAISLNVSERAPPPLIQLPSEIQELQEVTASCFLNFSCSGYKIHLQWSLEGHANTLTFLNVESVSTESRLTFRAQWIHHGKNLTCQLWDPTQQQVLSEETVGLDVKHTPKLEVQVSPREATVREGESVTMTCQVISSHPEYWHVWWLKDGTLLSRERTFSLTLPRVTRQMSGKYQCQAQNAIGSGISEGVDLKVHYPPQEVITVIQNSAPIREGDSVSLYCTYNSSYPRVTHYSWNIVGFRDHLQPAWLMIQKVAWNRAIQCSACNKWCSWSPSVNLDVHYAPKDVRVLISPPTEIHSGYRVLLQCDFSSSRPTDVHFFWKKNGIPLKEGRDLRFEAITPEDAGSYHCLVNNSIGQTTSQAWELRVLYAPRGLHVSISPKDGVVEGKTAVLSCEGDANPPIFQYTWFDWNNQDIHHYHQTLKLDPVTVQHSGAYWCQGVNQLGRNHSPPSTLTVHYSAATISRRAAMGVGFFLAILLLAIWGVKLRQTWKRIRSQQGFQENSNGQSFFVRNIKARRTPQAEGPHSLGCYNPVMEDTISYATLHFPLSETNAQRPGGARNPEARGLSPNRDDTVTYSVVQRRQVGDYENVTPEVLEDEGIHYSELIHFGVGERPVAPEGVDYVTLKH